METVRTPTVYRLRDFASDDIATLVAILQAANHIYNVHNTKDDSEWAQHEAEVLEEIGVAKEGLREFEEDIIDRAGS